MRRSVSLCLLLATVLPPTSLFGQGFDAPVRYENDFVSADFHRSRRTAVLERLPAGAVVVVFGAPHRNRSNDVNYEYRQASDFLYLTGSDEPGSALLLLKDGVTVDGRTAHEILFVPPRDPSQEVWLGRRFGTERAVEQLGLQVALESTRFDEVVTPLLQAEGARVFHLALPDGVPSGSDLEAQLATFLEHVHPLVINEGGLTGFVLTGIVATPSRQSFDGLRGLARRGFNPALVSDPELRTVAEAFVGAETFEDWELRRSELLQGRPDGTTLRALLDEFRTIKADEEMAVLRKAIDITVAAHRAVMQQVEPGWAEYEIEALVEYTFKKNGSEYPGFPSIVGSGENSVILHYETNRRTTEPGDVIVIDIGAEYHGYTADVTRTIPVSGTFTAEQRAIYDLVYRAQSAGIEATRAGNPFQRPHQAAEAILANGLAELGLIESPRDQRGLRRFFMHGTSHYLGLDVHDVGAGGPMEAGTVITVEPGIYIPAAEDIDPKWWNIGVRIEDDVLVTDGDPVILSAGVPRRPDNVEALMRRRPAS